jgi:hypothetical protein
MPIRRRGARPAEQRYRGSVERGRAVHGRGDRECYDGPFGIGLRTDGPHALIAGKTGAEKSTVTKFLAL